MILCLCCTCLRILKGKCKGLFSAHLHLQRDSINDHDYYISLRKLCVCVCVCTFRMYLLTHQKDLPFQQHSKLWKRSTYALLCFCLLEKKNREMLNIFHPKTCKTCNKNKKRVTLVMFLITNKKKHYERI